MAHQFSFVEKKGDLFSSEDSLAHCVSEDFNMSKGIAVIFKKWFGHVEDLKNTRTKTGGCTFLIDKDRVIL